MRRRLLPPLGQVLLQAHARVNCASNPCATAFHRSTKPTAHRTRKRDKFRARKVRLCISKVKIFMSGTALQKLSSCGHIIVLLGHPFSKNGASFFYLYKNTNRIPTLGPFINFFLSSRNGPETKGRFVQMVSSTNAKMRAFSYDRRMRVFCGKSFRLGHACNFLPASSYERMDYANRITVTRGLAR